MMNYPEDIQKGCGKTRVEGTVVPFVLGCGTNLLNRKPCEYFWATEAGDMSFVSSFLDYLESLAAQAADIAKEKFGYIEEHIQKCYNASVEAMNSRGMQLHKSNLERLQRFMYQLPVISFNGQVSLH